MIREKHLFKGRAKKFRITITMLALVCLAMPAMAQELPPTTMEPPIAEIPKEIPQPVTDPAAAGDLTTQPAPVAQTAESGAEISPSDIAPETIGPIVFTYWERAAITDARKSRGHVRARVPRETTKPAPEPKIKPPPQERYITLGGILYVSGENWIIWLNGKRVTPTAIPKEIIDLNVYEGYVDMKWFDDYSNQIFPLRLHPHERFNIDSRVFLPG
jgi:hypothetical protein